MFKSIVVGTDGSDTATQAVRQAVDLARAVGAKLELVSAYEPVPAQRLQEERRDAPEDLQWAINPREDVDVTLEAAAAVAREAGVTVNVYPRQGDPADSGCRRGAGGRSGRRGQQGHDRRQALPAGLGAEQGLPPRSLLGVDHSDYLTTASSRLSQNGAAVLSCFRSETSRRARSSEPPRREARNRRSDGDTLAPNRRMSSSWKIAIRGQVSG